MNIQAIATVVAVIGKAFARNASLEVRALKPGDTLLEGETIITSADSRVELSFMDGSTMEVPADQSMLIATDLVQSGWPGAEESALAATTAEDVLQALAEGKDIDTTLEAPAAGIEGGETGEGNDFVRLLRVTEEVSPLTYAFESPPVTEPPVFERGLIVEEEVVVVPPALSVTVGVEVPPGAGGGPSGGVVISADGRTASLIEGTDGESTGKVVHFTIQLNQVFDQDVQVTYQIVPGTAGAPNDFFDGPLTGTVTIPAGQTSFVVSVDIVQDHVVEGTESFQIVLTDAVNATINPAASAVTVNIVDDDLPPVAVNDAYSTNEGEDGSTVFASVLGNDTGALNVDGTPAEGETLTVTTTGTITTTAGGTVAMNPNGTFTYVPPAENFNGPDSFQYSMTDGYNGTSSATVAITVNPAPVFSINDVTVNEDAGTITFTVTKTGATDVASSVHYDVAPDTAVTPGDYTAGTSALSGDLNFAANVITQTITLNITDDAIYELTENFNVNLSAPVQATIADAQGVGTITDNDTAPAFSINDVTVNEDAGTITFTVTKTGATDVASSVDFSVTPNTAVTPGDYSGTLTGTLNFAANATTQTITLNVTDDAIYELTENFNVNLLNPVQATIADGLGVGTITDNDTPPPVTYEGGAAWLMNDQWNSPQQTGSVDIKAKDGAITLMAGRTIHWDIRVTGDVGSALTLAGVSLPPGTSSIVERLYSANGDTLFRFYLTADSTDVVLNPNDQFSIDMSGNTTATGIQTINSDEFVLPHANYQGDYSTELDSGSVTAGDDADWLSTDTDGGEFAVASPVVQIGQTVDYLAGNDLSYGTTADDTLSGGDGADFIDGRAGDDILHGNAGNDVLMGGLGNDTLNGGDGNDTLFGGPANDTLTGGAGADVFKWALGDQGISGTVDHITDFNLAPVASGGDAIDLGDLLIGEHANAASLDSYLSFSADGTGKAVITIDVDGAGAGTGGQAIVLDNVSYADLQTYAGGTSDADIITKLLDNGNLKTDI